MFIKLHWADSYRFLKDASFILNFNLVERIDENEDGSASIIVIDGEDYDILYPKESYEEICDLLSEVE